MFELLQDAIKSPAGSFAFVFAIMSLICVAVWKISHYSTKFGLVEKLEKSMDQIKEDMHYVKASIKLLKDEINSLAQRQSPVSMTRKGEEVVQELKINDLIENHWERIHPNLNKNLSKECNAYDMQVESFKIGENYQEFLTSEELNSIKNHAFKFGFNLDVYNLLFGIVIRDKYLSTKGFTTKDVDVVE